MGIIYSIIIPTFNRAMQLKSALQSLIEIKHDPNKYEIIIVDNGSTDDTRVLCASIIENNPIVNIRYYFDPIPGLLTGRHRGAREAKGEILCFLDDDVILSPEWLNAVSGTMCNHSDVQLMTGPCLPSFESKPPNWLESFWCESPYGGRFCGPLSLLDFGTEKVEIDTTFVWGINFIIRKNIFEDLRGFNPDTMPPKFQKYQGDGETGLSIKVKEKGYKAMYVPEAKVYHQVPSTRLTLKYFESRSYFQGVCDSYTYLRRTNDFHKYKYLLNRNFKVYIKKLAKLSFNMLCNLLYKISKYEKFEIYHIMNRINNKYREGFMFHQNAYNYIPIVKEWVTRKDYFDISFPENDNTF